jgi:hypothetical protein
MPAPKPKFKGKRLGNSVRAKMKSIGRSQKKAKKLIGVGLGATAAFDPHIGIPIAAVGVGFGLHEAVSRNALKRRLLKKPRAAGLMAKKFKGTEHEAFFRDIANKAAQRREKKSENWKVAQAKSKNRTKRKLGSSTISGKFRTPSNTQAKSKIKK